MTVSSNVATVCWRSAFSLVLSLLNINRRLTRIHILEWKDVEESEKGKARDASRRVRSRQLAFATGMLVDMTVEGVRLLAVKMEEMGLQEVPADMIEPGPDDGEDEEEDGGEEE